jgi:hypothetical protein
VLALHRRADDLVECRLHAVELQFGHRCQDVFRRGILTP